MQRRTLVRRSCFVSLACSMRRRLTSASTCISIRQESLYTGKPIDITRIASNDYYVDHVVPLAYRKDESLDNKVLVYAEASRYKSETLLVSPAVQRKMLPFWRMLRNAGLMSERKLNALIRTEISEGMLKSIIGRQFTENSWEAKLFTAAIAAKYPGTVVIPVKAGVIGAVRSRIGIPKSLKANQFYHAHDALLAAEVGRYMELAKPAFVHNRVKYGAVHAQDQAG